MPQSTRSTIHSAMSLAKSDRTLVWARWLIILIFVLWAINSLSRLVWVILSPPTVEQPLINPVNAVISNSGGQSANTIDYSLISKTTLFGKAQAGVAQQSQPVVQQEVVEVESAETTKLNMTLTGVIESSDSEKGLAIILHGRVEQAYAIDDKIPVGRNVSLRKVLSDRVIISNNGKTEALWLFDPSKAKQRSSVTTSHTPARSTKPARTKPVAKPDVRDEDDLASQRDQLLKEQSNLVQETVDDDGNVTHQIKQLPSSLAEVIRFGVARDGGEIIGYKIRPGRNPEMFSALGLETGDIVTEVNGISLTDSGSISKVYREMREATSANVTLLRNGQEETRVLELELDQ